MKTIDPEKHGFRPGRHAGTKLVFTHPDGRTLVYDTDGNDWTLTLPSGKGVVTGKGTASLASTLNKQPSSSP